MAVNTSRFVVHVATLARRRALTATPAMCMRRCDSGSEQRRCQYKANGDHGPLRNVGGNHSNQREHVEKSERVRLNRAKGACDLPACRNQRDEENDDEQAQNHQFCLTAALCPLSVHGGTDLNSRFESAKRSRMRIIAIPLRAAPTPSRPRPIITPSDLPLLSPHRGKRPAAGAAASPFPLWGGAADEGGGDDDAHGRGAVSPG